MKGFFRGRRTAIVAFPLVAASCLRPQSTRSGHGRLLKAAIHASLLDHIVGADQERLWGSETEHLGGLETDHRFVLGGRLHREVSRLLALEDANRRSLAARTGLGSGGESGY